VKKRKKKITGLIHGVFDVIHVGHINYFKEAKSKVDKLIVSVTSDEFVNKGPGKPIFNLKKRMELLKSIRYIDKVIESNYPTAIENIRKIRPDIYIKGKDYKNLKRDISKNILLEKKEVNKFGGKLIFTNSELHSSSSLANNVFNFINEDIKKVLKKINKSEFSLKFNSLIERKIKKKILVIGEPIYDILRFVKPSGKSNKNNIISTQFSSEEINAGGTLLPIKFLKLFCDNISFLFSGTPQDFRLIKKDLPGLSLIKLQSKNKLIKKIRYVDEYTSNRLFQNNINEDNKLTFSEIKKINNFLIKNYKKYDHIIFFNYGYIFNEKKLKKTFNKISKKLILNVQSNSYNFGYNLANEYTKGNIISLDEEEFRLLTKEKDEELRKLIKRNLKIFRKFKFGIITQGKKGAHIVLNNKIISIPTIFKPKIDSTGSGDIFLTMFAICQIFSKFNVIESTILSHISAGLHANNLGNRFKLDLPIINKSLDSILK